MHFPVSTAGYLSLCGAETLSLSSVEAAQSPCVEPTVNLPEAKEEVAVTRLTRGDAGRTAPPEQTECGVSPVSQAQPQPQSLTMPAAP